MRLSNNNYVKVGSIVVDQMFRTIMRFAVGVFMARICMEHYSYYILTQTMFGYGLFLTSGFIVSPYIVFLHKKDTVKDEYNAVVGGMMIFASLIFVLLYFCFYIYVYERYYWTLIFVFVSTLMIVGDIFNNFIRMIFISDLKYIQSLVNSLFCFLLFILSFGVAYWMGVSDVRYYMFFLGLSYLVPSLISWVYKIEKNWFARSFAQHIIVYKKHFSYGRWLFLDSIVNYAIDASFPLILVALGKNNYISSLGVYMSLFALFNPIIMIMQNYYMPKLSGLINVNISGFYNEYKISLFQSMVLVGPLIILVVLFGNKVIYLVYGLNLYVPGYVLIIWGLAKVVELMSVLTSSALRVNGKTAVLFGASVFTFIIFIFLNIWLIKMDVLLGIASSLLITKLIKMIILSYYFNSSRSQN